jgi:hypothetical protein
VPERRRLLTPDGARDHRDAECADLALISAPASPAGVVCTAVPVGEVAADGDALGSPVVGTVGVAEAGTTGPPPPEPPEPPADPPPVPPDETQLVGLESPGTTKWLLCSFMSTETTTVNDVRPPSRPEP